MITYTYTLYCYDIVNGSQKLQTADTEADARQMLADLRKELVQLDGDYYEQQHLDYAAEYQDDDEIDSTAKPIYISDKICTSKAELDDELMPDSDYSDQYGILREIEKKESPWCVKTAFIVGSQDYDRMQKSSSK